HDESGGCARLGKDTKLQALTTTKPFIPFSSQLPFSQQPAKIQGRSRRDKTTSSTSFLHRGHVEDAGYLPPDAREPNYTRKPRLLSTERQHPKRGSIYKAPMVLRMQVFGEHR
ncbi:unnamed protein product, partial [Pleuronectes platessa]